MLVSIWTLPLVHDVYFGRFEGNDRPSNKVKNKNLRLP